MSTRVALRKALSAHKEALQHELRCVDVMLLDFEFAQWRVAASLGDVPGAFVKSVPAPSEPVKPAPVGVNARRLAIAQSEGTDHGDESGTEYTADYIEACWRAEKVPSPSRGVTNTLLSEWTKKGYLKRVSAGMYTCGPKAP